MTIKQLQAYLAAKLEEGVVTQDSELVVAVLRKSGRAKPSRRKVWAMSVTMDGPGTFTLVITDPRDKEEHQ